ncbi:MAG: hypothetical protein WC809_16315 [Sinimarinibacterium sp.]
MTMSQMGLTQQFSAGATGLIFLTALLTGVWKWRRMLDSPTHLAPPYVDIAHRAALFYSFAGLLVWHFAGWSVWPEAVNLVGAVLLFAFFIIAIAAYIALGYRNQTDNQFKEHNFNTTTGTLALAIAEIIGFLILFSGTLAGLCS